MPQAALFHVAPEPKNDLAADVTVSRRRNGKMRDLSPDQFRANPVIGQRAVLLVGIFRLAPGRHLRPPPWDRFRPGIPQRFYGLIIRETALKAEWQQLWADVQALLAKAGGQGTREK
jgi:hypothetical protein